MEQRDESTVNNNSGDKPPSSQNPSEIPTSATNDEPEIVNCQGLPDSETTNVNHSDNPITKPETQSSSPSNNQNLDPPSPLVPPPPKIPSEDDVSNPKFMSVPGSPSNCSDDDFPISYMPDPGPAIQKPPVQVMERADQGPGTPSAYRIPSHVFARTNTGAPEWSLPSNESLFSIHMGNMSFSRELEWLNSEMSGDPLPPLTSDNNNGGSTNNQIQDNKPNDPSTSNHQSQVNNLSGKSKIDQRKVNKPNDNTSTSVDQSQANKFNDMSQGAGKFHQDSDEMTESKAAETMRQVIMESSGDNVLSCASATSRADGSHHSKANDASRHSDCSAKSFSFGLRSEGGTSQRSPRGFQFQERPKQKMQTQTETRTPKESSSEASSQRTKPFSNARCNFLCWFNCCIK
ncbi:hypothetical protein QN277_006870 [Acacia crassicarpa]|uniref:Uncharacterized protein n=1 Tax=Acacia crassicarpa TaxID=499986 RepID=A0AAE1M888_9FABA|nr:hypothetical protein QN277_006870 [Acacia crassicarpa]